MKLRSLSLLLCGALALFTSQVFAAPGAAPNPLAPQFSGAVNDVVKLSQSGVDVSVVLAYVKTSAGPYQPGADEIIKLRDMGIKSEVITAMLERGSELRRQTPPPQPAAYAGYTQPNAGSTQPVTYADTQSAPQPVTYAQPVYTDPTPSVVYIGSSYPWYSSYGYSSFYYPGYSFGFGSRYCAPGFSFGSRYCAPGYGYRSFASCPPRVNYSRASFAGAFAPAVTVNVRSGGNHFSGGFQGSAGGARFSGGGMSGHFSAGGGVRHR